MTESAEPLEDLRGWRLREDHRAFVNWTPDEYRPGQVGPMLHFIDCKHTNSDRVPIKPSIVEALFELEQQRKHRGLSRAYFFSETCLIERA